MGKEGRNMITQIFKQTAAYKVMIIVFLLFTLMFIVTIHSFQTYTGILIFFLLEMIILGEILMVGFSKVNKVMKKEWQDPLEMELDPAKIKRALEQQPKIVNTVEGYNMQGICEMLLGNVETSLPLFQKALQLHPDKKNQFVLYCNLAKVSLQQKQMEQAKQYFMQAKSICNQLPSAIIKRNQCELLLKHIEMQIGYIQGTYTAAQYIAYLKKRLLSDYATLRVRMDIRYQLACLYHEQKDDERVYEQLRWLEKFANKTIYVNRVHEFLEERVSEQ
ncbi:tetratricopeptide repeat protein [Eubacterium sp. AM18-26]|nr:tetratricopeptide repeat protein [Eubacterium sp. AM18-26]RHO23514.1 tetratricopeptide repeat protein [Eubacterium sp. AM18-10LB-B]RHO28739.1 tetratricopeptide repeat protein [Erysipelotrichaceae bacterium AM17-60]